MEVFGNALRDEARFHGGLFLLIAHLGETFCKMGTLFIQEIVLVNRLWIAVLGLFMLCATAYADQAQDVVIGNGTAGPYSLTWKQVAAGTESVQVNTVLQIRTIDYKFDPNAGTITFTHPLAAKSAAQVSYMYDPAHAVRTGANLAIPLSFDLAKSDHSSLTLEAAYGQTGTAANAGSLSVALGGGWQGAHQQLTTHLLFAPQPATAQPGKSSNTMDEAALAVSGSSDVSKIAKVSFGFSHVGTDVGKAALTDGMQVGMQTLTLGSTIAPSKNLSAFVNYSQVDPLASGAAATTKMATGLTMSPSSNMQLRTNWSQATTKGVATTSNDVSLTAKPNSMTQLAATMTSTSAPGDAHDTHTMDLTAKVDPSKSLSIQTQLGQSAAGTAGTTQTAAVNVAASPADNTKLNASLTVLNAPGQTTDKQAMNVTATVDASKTVAIAAGAAQSRLGDASDSNQKIAIKLSPQANIQLHTAVLLRQTNNFDSTATDFGGTIKPASYLQFSADYTSRDASSSDSTALDSLDSSTAQVALTPVKGLKITGNYEQNPNDAAGNPQRVATRGLGLETTVGDMHLTGAYNWCRNYNTPTVGTTLNLGLGLRVSKEMQITGAFQQTLAGADSDRLAGTSLYTLGITHNLGDRFNLSMTGTLCQQPNDVVTTTPNYTASANLGMKF